MIAATAQVPPKTFSPVPADDANTKAQTTIKTHSNVAIVMKRMWKPLRDIGVWEAGIRK